MTQSLSKNELSSNTKTTLLGQSIIIKEDKGYLLNLDEMSKDVTKLRYLTERGPNKGYFTAWKCIASSRPLTY